MRLHFQGRPWDLYVVIGLSIVLGLLILGREEGLIAAIPLVIFAPGYVAVAALFPDDEGIDWIERTALSFGLSIGIVPLLALLLNFTPAGISLNPLVISVLIFTVSAGFVSYARRMRLPLNDRLSATIDLNLAGWQEYSSREKALTVGLVVSLIFAGSVLTYVATTPQPGERFTEFYILGPDGVAENYPTEISPVEEGRLIIGVASHEFERVDYTVKVDRVGVVIVWNQTGGYNETMEVGSPVTMDWLNLTLDHETNWTYAYTFTIDSPGLWKVRILLFRDGDLGALYRNLHLMVSVRDA